MKSVSFLVVLFLLPLLCRAGDYDKLPEQKDRKYYQLKGTVMQVTEKQWRPSADSLVAISVKEVIPDNSYNLERSEQVLFDSSGRIQNTSSSDPDDRKRKVLKQTSRSFYYQKDRLTAVRLKEENAPADSVSFYYRKNGLVDHYSLYNGKNDLQYKVTYVYKSGKIFTVRKNNAENVPVSLVRYKYDKDRLVETQHFDEQFRLSETRRYSAKRTPDNELNESYAVSDAQGKMKEGMTWVKDSMGHVLEQNVVNDNREVTEYKSFAYDSHGFPVEEKIISPLQELMITNRYIYDDKGNWVRKEIFYGDRLRSVVVRELKYF